MPCPPFPKGVTETSRRTVDVGPYGGREMIEGTDGYWYWLGVWPSDHHWGWTTKWFRSPDPFSQGAELVNEA